jgi:hypothetical protein
MLRLICVTIVLVLVIAQSTLQAAAPTFRSVCLGSGFASPPPGAIPVPVPFNSVSSSVGQLTSATTGTILSGRVTINTAGLVCRYIQTSGSFTITADGTGSGVGTFARVAGSSSQCTAIFTVHTDTVSAADGTSRFVNTDPGSTGSGTCVPH